MSASSAYGENGKATTQGKRWSQRVGALTAVPALIRQLGADPVALLNDIGLGPGALEAPEQRIPYAALGALFRGAATRTRCAHFGLLCGRAWSLSDLGVLGEAVRNSPTMGSALRMLTAHQHMNGGGVAFVLNRGGVVDLGYAIFQPGVIGASQIYEAAMAAACNFLRELGGNGWTPLEVHFPFSKPRDVEPYRRFFRAPLRFDSEFCALRFAVDWLHRPIENADPERMRIAQEAAEADGRGDLLQQVCSALRVQLLSDSCSGDDVAQVLAMHRRTLNRRLHAQGETFQNVLDEVRFEVARQLLSDTELALDDIAAATGYAGVSPFMRSFRRWSGTTPTRWRRTAGAQHGRVHL